jgi:hypothetical protein
VIKDIIKRHWIAIILSLVVGLIMIAPHLIFAIELGSDYRGIYMMQTDSESIYLARMQEIVDGYPMLGAVPYAEYKDRPALLPPTITDFILAGSSLLFGISLPMLLLITKAFLPALLFLLIYWLILKICTAIEFTHSSRFVALAGATTILLAYDSIGYLSDIMSTSTFLLWSRPVNPITGALLISCLALLLWYRRNDRSIYIKWVIAGGVIFALMITSYFFSWGFALAFMTCWAVMQFVVNKKHSAYATGLMIIVGFIFALPYLYQARLAAAHPDFAYAASKIGLFHSHAPVVSRIIVAIIILLVLAVIIERRLLREDWWRLSMAFTLGGIVSLNQQIITGVTIWPFHFVQYVKPFSIIICFVFLFYIVRPRLPRVFPFIMALIIGVSLVFGIMVQVAVYRNSFARYAEKQRYNDLFEWFNKNASLDCVILAQDDNRRTLMFWIPAFTHCNSAVNSNNHYILPFERVYHDYLVMLRMRGVTAKDIKTYLTENRAAVIEHFYGVQNSHPLANEYRKIIAEDNIVARIEQEYPDFYRSDFLAELTKYQIDYVVADGGLRPDLIRALHLPLPATIIGGVSIYSIPK